jgi:hypothetical protein
MPAADIFPFQFWTPNTPDLGCFVRRKHGFRIDAEFRLWNEFAPWDANGYIPHQAYFRVVCGKAGFYQRAKVWMRQSLDPLILGGAMPDCVLGGDFRPYPSEWFKFSPQKGEMYYWFSGEHRDPAQANWHGDAVVGHSFDLYDNGTLSTVGFDDTGADRDCNDLVLEVAIVYRRAYFRGLEVLVTEREGALEKYVRDDLPKLAKGRVPSKMVKPVTEAS